MPRQTKQELDDEILNSAAMLFASHGFKETSVQRIADAVGYSKAGLLHRYPSKEALQDAVIARCAAEMHAVGVSVAARAPGPERDREVITALARMAVRRPGLVALLLSLLCTAEPDVADRMQAIGESVFAAFAETPDAPLARRIRVIGALGALSVACLSLRGDASEEAAAHLIATSCDALGHDSSPTR